MSISFPESRSPRVWSFAADCGKAPFKRTEFQNCPLPSLTTPSSPASPMRSSGSRPPLPPRPISTPRKRSSGAPTAARWRRSQRVNRVDISLLRGVDRVRDLLVENTRRFARALPANNALLWGARGMGKSSLVKAAHAAINREKVVAGRLKLVEIHREDIEGLPALMSCFARGALPFHRLLRRPLVRRRRHVLQVAESGARGRRRRPARQRPLLCDVEPAPPHAARDDGERAVERDQSGRGGRGEGVALRPLRPLARLPSLQPGRLSRHGPSATPSTIASTRRATGSRPRRSNGRRRAAPAPAAPPGNSSRISPGRLGKPLDAAS